MEEIEMAVKMYSLIKVSKRVSVSIRWYVFNKTTGDTQKIILLKTSYN